MSGRLPVLTRYDGERLACVAMPIGGIGTGTVSLGGRGDLRDWEVGNRPAKGFAPPNSFFALWARRPDGSAVTRALEGALRPPFEGWSGATHANHGLPRFRDCVFEAAYPFATVRLSDADVPVTVRLEAFNPLIPGDADASGIPMAVLRFVLVNGGGESVEATVCGSVQNFMGPRGVNERRGNGVFLTTDLTPDHEDFGSLALATTAEDVRVRTAWADAPWGGGLLDFWDELSTTGTVTERPRGEASQPMASVAATVVVPARSECALTFLLAWHFPNRVSWSAPAEGQGCGSSAAVVGNHYATRFADASDVIERTLPDLDALEATSRLFVDAFVGADLPTVVKEAALYNLTALRSQTSFRTPDGRFFGWEGCGPDFGCCYGSCTHVWNYEPATAFLFADLAVSMREVELLHATRDDGHMSFRVNLPLAEATGYGVAAADGQMGCLVKLHREWQLSGDDDILRRLWPRARAALAFAWVAGGWDADHDGVMEGCQHNTMDVEYFGPNPQMTVWYLAALRAAEEMAVHVGDTDFADRCHSLFEAGRAWLDEHLFNGEFYEQQIRPANDGMIAPGLRAKEPIGAEDVACRADPPHQLGGACLVDQLVGQVHAHVGGLGHLVDPDHARRALASVHRYNFKADLHDHFNQHRTYAVGDEAATVMATYPLGRRPTRPFFYCNEVMTGFEYTAAVGMLYEGQRAEGLQLIEAVRARYDGRRRNPFDEAECGHHYARAMASWGALLALTGFRYSAVTGELRFDASPSRSRAFWSNGRAWGTCEQVPGGETVGVRLTVLWGTIAISRIVLAGVGNATVGRTVGADETVDVTIDAARDSRP